MRVVLDTNILVSALMVQTGNPAAIYRAWQEGHFTFLTCVEHLDRAGYLLRQRKTKAGFKRAARLNIIPSGHRAVSPLLPHRVAIRKAHAVRAMLATMRPGSAGSRR